MPDILVTGGAGALEGLATTLMKALSSTGKVKLSFTDDQKGSQFRGQ
jgi:hypothetical protein